jgi:hypothetical protein
MLFVCRIHNNSLGASKQVSSWEEGRGVLKKWAEEQFGRDLTDEEIESLDNEQEIYNDEDGHNIYTFSYGICE